MAAKLYWYSTSEVAPRYRLQSAKRTLTDVAIDAAEDFSQHHDGWKALWPITFFLYEGERGQPVGTFPISRKE